MEKTSYVMTSSYEIEKQLINREWTEDQIGNEYRKHPSLRYLHSSHNFETGMTGVAIEDTTTKEIIIGYAGTNTTNDAWNDIRTDVVDIFAGAGGHYQSAFDFYEEVKNRYGDRITTVTGHSLGGNYAQMVAIEYNIPNGVVYNSAPLYLGTTELVKGGMNLYNASRQPYLAHIHTKDIQKLLVVENKINNYTGDMVRIRSKDDILNVGSEVGLGYS